MKVGRVDFVVVEAKAKCEAKSAEETARCVHYVRDDGVNAATVCCKWRGSDGDDFICEKYEGIVEDINDHIERKLGIFEEI